MKKLLVICGATATGKTALAVECAKKLDSEIISADSQLIYRGLNIGTAKPAQAEMQGVMHHMIDIISPEDSFSVSEYEERALPIADRLLGEDKTPVICGGTGFYINSILYKLGYGKTGSDVNIRHKYENILATEGKDRLFSLLSEADPETAAVLHPNDTKRVIRALEIFDVTGRKKSDQRDEFVPRYAYEAFAVDFPRDELYRRIDARVDEMFERGLVEEVRELMDRGIDTSYQCFQAIGYKEVCEGLKNKLNDSTMRDIIKQNTRHYAKRQLTFFKKLKGIHWLKPQEATADNVLELYNGNQS